MVAGCNPSAGTNGESGGENPALNLTSGAESGKEILGKMANAYRDAAAYSDQGKLTLTIRGVSESRTETFPFAVEFARPGKLRIEAYSAIVASDGQKLLGKLKSPETNDFDGQVLEIDAPEKVTTETIMAVDQSLFQGISGRFQWPPPQLSLLLQEQNLADEFKNAERVAVLPSQTIDGRPCHCVQIEDDTGRSVWSVDKETSLLRRFEFPREGIAKQLGMDPSEVSLVADFTAASLTPPADVRFSFDIPAEAKRVKFLVQLPPLPPGDLIGKPTPPFAFDTFSGADFATKGAGKLTPDALGGQVAMLLFWSNQDGAALNAFNQLAKTYAGRADVKFFAIMTDPVEAVTDANMSRAMAEMKPIVYIARAPHALAAFGISAPSAAVFLGRDGLIHDAYPFDTISAIRDAPQILDSLVANKPWHPQALGRLQTIRRQYEERLVLAKTGVLPVTPAAKQSPPEKHRLVSVWKQATIKDPGNLTRSMGVNGNLLAIEASRAIVELDAKGQIVKRYDLKLPEGSEIGFIRTGKKANGEVFYVGTRLFQPKVFVFNAKWEIVAAYPDGPVPENEDNPAVADVQVADVDGDKEDDILIGYAGVQGVHLVTPDGHRRWTNRSASEISRLAIAPVDNKSLVIYAASYGAPTAAIDHRGKELGRWQQQANALLGLFVSKQVANGAPEQKSPEFLGFAQTDPRQLIVWALMADGRAKWEYPLPPGTPSTQIEAFTWGRVIGDASHWIVAAPDGSVHFLSAEGKILDRFNVGALLTGISAAQIDGKPALVVAKQGGEIEAFRFDATEAILPAEKPAALPSK